MACALLAATLSLVQIGCGDGRPERVTVSGRVTVDGKPLDRGVIEFVPRQGRPSHSQIDSQGRFQLSCFPEQHDGAVLGIHQVAVSATEELGPLKRRWLVPKKYADYRTSEITATIDRSRDDLEVALTWGGEQPYIESIAAE